MPWLMVIVLTVAVAFSAIEITRLYLEHAVSLPKVSM
jgi:hypothetical protein